MNNGGGIGPTGTPPTRAGQAGSAEMPSINKPGFKQRKAPTDPAASMGPVDRVKTLKDPLDLDKLRRNPDLVDEADTFSLPSDEYRNKHEAGRADGSLPWKRPPNADAELESTWRQWEKIENSLQGLARKPGLSEAQLVSMARDQRLVEELVHALQRREKKDGGPEAKKARAYMDAVLNHWRQRHPMTQPFRSKGTGTSAYLEGKADAIRLVRASRPSLGVADDALVLLEDLYTDILNEPSLAHRVSTAQREQLGRDLQTLYDLVETGKANGWLPEAGQPPPDPGAQEYMEDKISKLAASISSHVQKILATNSSMEDDAALERFDHRRKGQVSAAKAFLSAASALEIPPGTAPRFVAPRKQVADALIKAHPVRGREIMDSLPPGYVTGLLAQGAYVEDLARNLMDRADLLHVSQSGFGEGTLRLAFLDGLSKAIRFSNGRALSSWQAALVRRSVTMLALAGAPRSKIRKVRDSLVSRMRAASGRGGTEGKQNVEGSVSIFLWDHQSFHSLSSYRREIERSVADRDSAERQKWRPLMNLHTAMDNLSAVLEAGCSVDDALKVFDHDMEVLDEEDDDMGLGDIVSAQGDGLPAIPLQPIGGAQANEHLSQIGQPEHPYTYLLTPAVEDSDDD